MCLIFIFLLLLFVILVAVLLKDDLRSSTISYYVHYNYCDCNRKICKQSEIRRSYKILIANVRLSLMERLVYIVNDSLKHEIHATDVLS
jgi:hypothetical protein